MDEPEARPIKKGKKHPKCEFGTTFQASFNRQGFMITIENFIGKPNDKTLYPQTLEIFKKRMNCYPDTAVTDLGYRSLYKGFKGDKVWSLLCQTAHNLKKFLQLYRAEKLEEKSLVKLGLLA